MSLNQAQQAIVDQILTSNYYEDYGNIFLGISDPTDATNAAKAVESEALTRIGDRTMADSDDQVLRQIALWNMQRSTGPERKLYFYTLGHRSGYSINDISPSDTTNEICCTSSPTYISRAQATSSITQDAKPDHYVNLRVMQKDAQDQNRNCMFPFSSDNNINAYYIGENGQLMGKERVHGFSYYTSTAACVYCSKFSNPIIYQGYCFETQRGRTGYATGGSLSFTQTFFLTPGGGPLNENNWIIKYVEYGTRTILPEDTLSPDDASWVLFNTSTETPRKYTIIKIYIHLFFPNGAYIRTVLDRSNSADFTGAADSNFANNWIYHDYRNAQAVSDGKTFKNIWNTLIYNKYYRPIGGTRPGLIDISFDWNGKGDASLQAQQVAYLNTNKSTKWRGGERP